MRDWYDNEDAGDLSMMGAADYSEELAEEEYDEAMGELEPDVDDSPAQTCHRCGRLMGWDETGCSCEEDDLEEERRSAFARDDLEAEANHQAFLEALESGGRAGEQGFFVPSEGLGELFEEASGRPGGVEDIECGRAACQDPDDLEADEQSAGLERWGVRTSGQGRESDPGGAIVSASIVALAVLAGILALLAAVLGEK